MSKTNTDSYFGVEAHFDNKVISIIEYLLSLKGAPYTFVQVAKATGMPTAECSRYLRPECFERRDWEWLLQMKKWKPTAYKHYLNNHQIREKIDENGISKKELYVNFSKHTIFLMGCRLRNVQVYYGKHGEKRLVHLFEHLENERTKIYYETPTTDHQTFENFDESTGNSSENDDIIGGFEDFDEKFDSTDHN